MFLQNSFADGRRDVWNKCCSHPNTKTITLCLCTYWPLSSLESTDLRAAALQCCPSASMRARAPCLKLPFSFKVCPLPVSSPSPMSYPWALPRACASTAQPPRSPVVHYRECCTMQNAWKMKSLLVIQNESTHFNSWFLTHSQRIIIALVKQELLVYKGRITCEGTRILLWYFR